MSTVSDARNSAINSYESALGKLEQKHGSVEGEDRNRTTLQILAMIEVTMEAMDEHPVSRVTNPDDRKQLVQVMLLEYKPLGVLPPDRAASTFAEYFLYKYAELDDRPDMELLHSAFYDGLNLLPRSSKEELLAWRHKFEWGTFVEAAGYETQESNFSEGESESNLVGMNSPMRKSEYLSKYRISEKKLDAAISVGKIKAALENGQLWIEDKRI